jgi:protein gp37
VTSIEWTQNEDGTAGKTWNPVRGCLEISPGCARCYAKTFAERWRGIAGHPYEQGFDPRLVPEKLAEPMSWKKPQRVFVNSMSDLFGDFVSNEYIAACFGVMAACERHTLMTLTKRADRMVEWFEWVTREPTYLRTMPTAPRLVCGCAAQAMLGMQWSAPNPREWPLLNAWIGVSVENRKHGVPRIDLLRQVPAAVRFLSVEPLLEDLGDIDLAGIHWVLIGGESGPKARPFDLAWARRVVAQCREQQVSCFVKQMGAVPVSGLDVTGNFRTHHGRRQYEMTADRLLLKNRKGNDMAEWPEDLRVREWPEVTRG